MRLWLSHAVVVHAVVGVFFVVVDGKPRGSDGCPINRTMKSASHGVVNQLCLPVCHCFQITAPRGAALVWRRGVLLGRE